MAFIHPVWIHQCQSSALHSNVNPQRPTIPLFALTKGQRSKRQLSKSLTAVFQPLSTRLIKPNFCNIKYNISNVVSNFTRQLSGKKCRTILEYHSRNLNQIPPQFMLLHELILRCDSNKKKKKLTKRKSMKTVI